jgi:uncharacterized protein (TIGR00290 family)
VRNRRVFIADGNAYFNRSGPRLVESAEILAEILHPGAFHFGHEPERVGKVRWMMKPVKALMSWSGGKDSALALHLARQRGDLEVAGLLTTLSAEFDRVSMHGVRRALLEAQADALGLPVTPLFIPTPAPEAPCPLTPAVQAPVFTAFPSNQDYESLMRAALLQAKAAGVEAVVFGDIHLEDLRRYREQRLAELGLRAVFPLWGRDPRELAGAVIEAGFKAVVVCVDGARLDGRFARPRARSRFPCSPARKRGSLRGERRIPFFRP